MRFIDSNVFIHAYINPKRKLREHEERIKEEAKGIVVRVNEGEEVVTTVVHLGEIANLLEASMPLKTAQRMTRGLLFKDNIYISEISRQHYLSAISTSERYLIGLNDALAYATMKRGGIQEIYSFDRHFDHLPEITRLTY